MPISKSKKLALVTGVSAFALLVVVLTMFARALQSSFSLSSSNRPIRSSEKLGAQAPGADSYKLDPTRQNSEIVESLVMLGDGGDALSDVWGPLADYLKGFSQRATVIVMGDNIYDAGIPPPSEAGYREAVRRLDFQLQTLRSAGIPSLFIPGNHDWNKDRPDGLASLKRQAQMVESALGRGSFQPRNGCPGPARINATEWFNLVVLDSEWWMYRYERPKLDGTSCSQRSMNELSQSIAQALSISSPSGFRILLSHHPLMSNGPHGAGSSCPGDFGCAAYKLFREQIFTVLEQQKAIDRRPIICVGAHDHSLQILKGQRGCDLFLVSGAMSHLSWAKERDNTIYSFEGHGFMQLDRLRSGEQVLTAYSIDPVAREVRPTFRELIYKLVE